MNGQAYARSPARNSRVRAIHLTARANRRRTIVMIAVYVRTECMGGAVMMAQDNYAAILDDTVRRLDAIRPEIDAWCARAYEHIEQRYREGLEELRSNFQRIE